MMSPFKPDTRRFEHRGSWLRYLASWPKLKLLESNPLCTENICTCIKVMAYSSTCRSPSKEPRSHCITPHSARTRACFWREAPPFSPRSHSHRESISSFEFESQARCWKSGASAARSRFKYQSQKNTATAASFKTRIAALTTSKKRTDKNRSIQVELSFPEARAQTTRRGPGPPAPAATLAPAITRD